MGSGKEKAVLKPKIDWNKIADTHPLWRDLVAENEGVTVSYTDDKGDIKVENLELFNSKKDSNA